MTVRIFFIAQLVIFEFILLMAPVVFNQPAAETSVVVESLSFLAIFGFFCSISGMVLYAVERCVILHSDAKKLRRIFVNTESEEK